MSIVDLKVPVIGESITEVTLSSWLKPNGSYVKLDEPICEFESDKATLEFPAEAEGTLIYVAAEGDDLAIGAIVARIDTSATQSSENKAPIEETKTVIQKPEIKKSMVLNVGGGMVEMNVPIIGESITEVTLSTWLKQDGDYVELDEAICEFESDKATLEFPAEAAGRLIHIAAEGADLAIGALVAKIDTSAQKSSGGAKTVTAEAAVASEITTASSTSYASGHPSPAAAKILAEKGIDSSEVKGSGVGGRITKEDAATAAKSPSTAKSETPKSTSENKVPISTDKTFSRGTKVEKMTRMRRTIASRLVEAKNDSAMLTTFNEVDLTNIMELRKQYQEKFVAKHGIKLGFMSLFAKACAQVLMEMPQVNAIIEGDSLIYHDYADISIAISTPTGLVVPPVHNVESLGFHEIEYKIKALAEKARDGKLTLDEMKGGTFTITNGGVFGSMLSTPILNKPQSAILGMHTIKDRPIAINGEVKIRPMMYLALSYDHRVIDGSSSVTFLVKVIELLQDPMRLMMNL
jgi:2-oxoglutarate dehydrogenase E2 component (dihydrolipoamide succinyltransferase)